MQRLTRVAAFTAAVAIAAFSARAEVKVVVDHNVADKATSDFKFATVPSPAKAAATTAPKVTVVDGDKDDNSRDASDLTKGTLPTQEDAPDANFFFNAGTDGGRLQLDLGSAVPVQQVNTYSWHANTRGPQVYKLYAADGTAKEFKADPKKGTDPTTCGWKLVASVDTRPKAGEPGGQYGVSVRDTDGPLGTYRYLLLDCSRTESDDDFGNTFFSRIDVVTTVPPAGK